MSNTNSDASISVTNNVLQHVLRLSRDSINRVLTSNDTDKNKFNYDVILDGVQAFKHVILPI